MPNSANLDTARAYQNAIQQYESDLISIGMFGFETAKYVTMNEGNKGKRTLTEGSVKDLTYEYSGGFNPVPNAFDYKPREVEVIAQSVDLQFVPQEYESTYLGMVRMPGQNPGKDLPYEAWHMMKIMEKRQQEQELAVWGGARIGPLPNNQRRKLIQNMDGFLTVTARELALGNSSFTPYAIAGGAWTEANAFYHIEKMAERLSPTYQSEETIAYAPLHVVRKYRRNFLDLYGKYTDKNLSKNEIQLEGTNCKLVGLPGLANSNRVLITTKENMQVDFDLIDDTTFINVETNKRQLDMWMDFKCGLNFAIVHNDILSVCDLA
jgi:hypothetical protein